MGRGFCYIAERRDDFNLHGLTESLGGIGVHLANPSNGAITRLSKDGSQMLTTETQLTDLLSRDSALTFQFWFPADVDLCCSYRRLSDGVCVHAYSLEGKNHEQRGLLKTWAMDYFREHAIRRTAVLLVFDPSEVTGEFDWDSFVLKEGGLPDRWPDVLGLRSTLVTNNPPRQLHEFENESINAYYLLTARSPQSPVSERRQ